MLRYECEYELPSDCVVLANSGPSLNKVDVFSLGYPVIAVSTAVRAKQFENRNPDIWALADKVNRMHGEKGQELFCNPEIQKVMPDLRRRDLKKINHVLTDEEKQQWYFCEYQHQRDKSRNIKDWKKQGLFSGKFPLLRGPHKSVTFALQWAHFMGAKTIIWAGCDLTANSIKDKYAYQTEEHDMGKKGGYLRTLNVVDKTLREWYPVALERGFEWYNWECGERMTDIGIPSFLGKGSQKKIVVSIPPPPTIRPEVGYRNKAYRAPVREVHPAFNRRHRSYKSVKTVNGTRLAPEPKINKNDIIDKYGRTITEPFNDPNISIEDNDLSVLSMMANLPPEEPVAMPEYKENKNDQRRAEQEMRQNIKLRNIRRRVVE